MEKHLKTLSEYRDILTTDDRKVWFDLGVLMFEQGMPKPEWQSYWKRKSWSQKRVRDEMLEYGWNAAAACRQNVERCGPAAQRSDI
jgi:hypothetical protein